MLGLFSASMLLTTLIVLSGLGIRSLRGRSAGAARSAARLEVLERVALAPKQGLALVRIGERHVVVSMGDGGVRTVLELGDAESGALFAPQDEQARPQSVTGPRVALQLLRLARGVTAAVTAPAAAAAGAPAGRRAARVRGCVLAAMLCSGLSAASAAPATADAAAVVAPSIAVAVVAPPAGAAVVAPPAAATDAVDGSGVEAVEQQAPAGAGSLAAAQAALPKLDVRLGGGEGSDLRVSGTVGSVIMIGMLALIPAMLLLMTSFTRILIVLHFLKQALGTQTAPPGQLLAALALMLTGFVMAPTLGRAHSEAFQPWVDGTITEGEMLTRGVSPFRDFMLAQTPERDILRFVEMSGNPAPATAEEIPLTVLVSAFAVSELRAAFQMGFAIFLPFVVIDLVVSAVLTSMGMFMLPPTMIALPCKLLLFVLADGWALTVQSLIASFR